MVFRPNHRTPWTAQQFDELKRLAEEGLSARAIARELGRTEEAIYVMANKIGASLKRLN
jgi:hypothetical protein